MKTKYLNFFSLFGALFFLTACDSSSASATGTAPEKACYESTCAQVINAAQIIDPKHEYRYPDKTKFPDQNRREQYRAPYAFLDLAQVSGAFALSTHFRLSHFALLEKGRYALVLPELVKRMEGMHKYLGAGLRITSGYRSPGYNSNTPDSASWSRHTYGDAVDLQHVKKSLKQLRAACVANKASFYLLYTKHIHCDWRALPLDPAFYPPAPSENNPDQALEDNAVALTKGSQIVYQRTAQTLTIATVLPLTDLEGDPQHAWVIHSPTGKVYEFFDSQFQFEPTEFGTYNVEVRVGDFFEINSRFNW